MFHADCQVPGAPEVLSRKRTSPKARGLSHNTQLTSQKLVTRPTVKPMNIFKSYIKRSISYKDEKR